MKRLEIKSISIPDDIKGCYTVVKELRSHVSQEQFEQQVKRQQQNGYKLIALSNNDMFVAIAGFRISECLAWGKFLYVDDLVTKSTEKSKGYGQKLLDYLTSYAKQQGCNMLHLDSGVQRFTAHRFYIKQGMDIKSHHFSISL
ncbi:MAG: GNAT family N-acetyltransferase [bacterium]|nr:GNAT family N-acetyltransferase [bacterium]